MSYRRVVLRAFGEPEQLELESIAELLTPGAGGVRVKVVLHCADQ